MCLPLAAIQAMYSEEELLDYEDEQAVDVEADYQVSEYSDPVAKQGSATQLSDTADQLQSESDSEPTEEPTATHTAMPQGRQRIPAPRGAAVQPAAFAAVQVQQQVTRAYQKRERDLKDAHKREMKTVFRE